MPKQRSPAVLYSYVVMSSGIYGFFWAVALLRDLNEIIGSPKFDIAALRRTVVVSLLLFAVFVLYLMSSLGSHRPPSLRWIALAVPFGLYALLIWLVLRVNREIGLLTSEPRPSTGSMIGLTVMFVTSLPILQIDINRLSSQGPRRAPAPANGR